MLLLTCVPGGNRSLHNPNIDASAVPAQSWLSANLAEFQDRMAHLHRLESIACNDWQNGPQSIWRGCMSLHTESLRYTRANYTVNVPISIAIELLNGFIYVTVYRSSMSVCWFLFYFFCQTRAFQFLKDGSKFVKSNLASVGFIE